jgi:putative ABC transport system permease protein
MLIDITILMDRHVVQQRTRFDPNSVSAYYLETTDGDNKAAIKRIQDAFRGRSGDPWKPSLLASPSDENPVQSLLNTFDRFLKSKGEAESTPPSPKPQEPPSVVPEPPTRRQRVIDERLRVDESLPIDVQSAEQWSERFDQFTKNLDYIMLILSGIGVTIAVLGIANTMLMSVSERIIEIGILKANGWSRKHVLSLIAYESAILGFLGGCLGSLIGWVGTLLANARFSDHVALYAGPGLLTFSVLFATILGLLAGLYPAVWAMRLMPMDAIRRG